MNILVIGGAGYIGSHVCKALKLAGFSPIVFDNFHNGHRWAVKWGPLIQGDLLDPAALEQAFQSYQPVGVVHLASYINCRESAEKPGKYYQNNVVGTLSLLEAIVRHATCPLVFSSTAAVYGNPEQVPIAEDHSRRPINVYGKTKLLAEEMLDDFFHAHQLRSVVLRYFNAAGADASAEIGEAHTPETHLIPLAILAALGKNPSFKIFGNDHATPDGTAVRDYIHVTDLAAAHVQALQWLMKGGSRASLNLGSGKGYSVQDVVRMIEKVMQRPVPHAMAPRNPSDPPILVASIAEAEKVLNWKPENSDLATIIASAVEWHQNQ
jgi:UDP-arabinose 4-epimerase